MNPHIVAVPKACRDIYRLYSPKVQTSPPESVEEALTRFGVVTTYFSVLHAYLRVAASRRWIPLDRLTLRRRKKHQKTARRLNALVAIRQDYLVRSAELLMAEDYNADTSIMDFAGKRLEEDRLLVTRLRARFERGI